MEGLLDRGDGGLLCGVGDFGELAAQEAAGGFGGGDDLAFLANPGGSEKEVDAGVGLAVGAVGARDGEVEGVAVKCLAVDLEWVGGDHVSVVG